MNSIELRNKFLKYFEDKGHKIIPSASLVPKEQDITESDMTLFTTAGMQQFKRFYVSPDEAPYARATSSQKCIRTGDIDEVGDDTHLSFFEMLGNFSFGYPSKEGSYFKKEAIEYAWEFLTEVLEIPKDRIHATYFNGEGNIGLEGQVDEESKKYLKEITKLPDDKIIGQPFEDNFWSLGSIGSPGGRTVEFYIDHIEVWNLVFNEFEWTGDRWEDLKFKGVDTGMGLERLLTTLNGHDNVYETDLFESIIQKIEKFSDKKYSDKQKEYRIISDHIKAATFAINDGVLPSNKGAGYVVRRLIRRAIVKIGTRGNEITSKLAKIVFEIYADVYQFDKRKVFEELNKEEYKFRNTLNEGLRRFDQFYNRYLGKHQVDKDHIFPVIGGKFAFDMFQSFGFPVELTLEEFEKRGMLFIKGSIKEDFDKLFNEEYEKHKELSRTASAGMFKGGLADAGEIAVKYHTATHLLHKALRLVLGEHVQQKGSNITAERLRFDFVHPDKMTAEQIADVENMVNEQINKDLPVTMEEMTVEEANNAGAIGLFEHKYGDKVKVYTIGSNDKYFSREICGGPHVGHTSEIGKFKIKKEESSSAGIRRIKAVLE